MTARISVAKDFSEFPAGRFLKDGDWSGERLRDELLAPGLRAGSLTVSLDGAMGYGSSFLEEAFGGLLRHGFTAKQLKERLTIESPEDPGIAALARGYANQT